MTENVTVDLVMIEISRPAGYSARTVGPMARHRAEDLVVNLALHMAGRPELFNAIEIRSLTEEEAA